jgi:hypothetical protein
MLSFHGLALATSLSLGFVGVLSSDIIRVPKGTKRSTNNGCIYIRMILSILFVSHSTQLYMVRCNICYSLILTFVLVTSIVLSSRPTSLIPRCQSIYLLYF